MDQLAERTGRRYGLVDYTGHPEAERVIVIMGSGGETARETVQYLASGGERVGVAQVRLYRPFPAGELIEALPKTVRRVAVLDRTKEPGALGEPLFLDMFTALGEAHADGALDGAMPIVIGGRYGLSSKEFSPGMVKAVFDELDRERPKRRFTIGINDDVSGTSLPYDPNFDIEPAENVRAVFFGLGSDGTVGANKNTIKILGEAGLQAQGYFVYDSKKSGSQTISHLRFGPDAIRAPYLVSGASFVGCHQIGLIDIPDVLDRAAPGATLLLNTNQPPERVWDRLTRRVQEQMLEKKIELYVIDAGQIARAAGLAGRTNTVLQTCFFAISGVLDREQAIERIKGAIVKTYTRRGQEVVDRNIRAVDSALEGLHRVELPDHATSSRERRPPVPADAPEFVRTITAAMMAGKGDELPVSALPVDGTYPTGTTKYEKRNISDQVAVWDYGLCIQCGNCSFVCPHSVIRTRYYNESRLADAPAGIQVRAAQRPGTAEHRLHAPGVRGGLHRLRSVRRGVPGLGRR